MISGNAPILAQCAEIFNDKKKLSTKLFLSVITKNLKWDVLAKNLVKFKSWGKFNDQKL